MRQNAEEVIANFGNFDPSLERQQTLLTEGPTNRRSSNRNPTGVRLDLQGVVHRDGERHQDYRIQVNGVTHTDPAVVFVPQNLPDDFPVRYVRRALVLSIQYGAAIALRVITLGSCPRSNTYG